MSALNIQPGRFYRTRDGEKAEVLKTGCRSAGGETVVVLIHVKNGKMAIRWYFDGGRYLNHSTSGNDLIAEWSDKPEIDWSKMPERAVAAMRGPTLRWYAATIQPQGLTDFGWTQSIGAEVWELYPQHVPKEWTGDWRDSLVIRPGVETEVSA